jgi:cold shock protein
VTGIDGNPSRGPWVWGGDKNLTEDNSQTPVKRAAMQRGTIKKLVADKGFGFIASGERGKDLFFHVSAVKDVAFDALFEGQSVDYEMESGPKGDRASVVIPA